MGGFYLRANINLAEDSLFRIVLPNMRDKKKLPIRAAFYIIYSFQLVYNLVS